MSSPRRSSTISAPTAVRRAWVQDKNAVAMVGTRQTTHYGLEVTRKLAYQLAYVGVTVVSGGARGIGESTTRSVVLSFVLIMIANYFLTRFML
mgnify:CR=1 FL=1